MTTTYDCTLPEQRSEGLEHAQRAISEKKCIVMPTDTVYGIAADAFSPLAVTLLLASKGRSRQMPPPVLIPRLSALDGLAADVPGEARQLAEAFWPGGLTLILHAQPSLTWDLGETKGTVALRIPQDEVALELLALTGPLAVSSANRTGQSPAQTGSDARGQLAESVEVYLEDGFRPAEGTEAIPSTIVDATSRPFRVARAGAISIERLREVVPDILDFDGSGPEAAEPEAAAESASADPDTAVTESEGAAEPEASAEPNSVEPERAEPDAATQPETGTKSA